MADKQDKPEVVSLTVQKKDGTIRTLTKGSDGRFKKVPKMLPTSEATAILRKTLMKRNFEVDEEVEVIDKESGRVIKTWTKRKIDSTVLEAAISNLVRIMTTRSNDPKVMMAVIQAFEAFYARAHGKIAINDEEKEALRTGGIKVVLVPTPAGLPQVEAKPKEELKKPDFIDAEIVETNPPKDSPY